MSADRSALRRAIERGERDGGAIEFKERLTRRVHLVDGRMESLVAQLRHRILSGDGEATYVLGVTDDGGLAGIAPDAFSETMDVLSLLADEADAHIADVETWSAGSAGNGNTEGLVGLATLREGGMFEADDDHLVIGTAGHVDHGKSTLVGTLVTGRADDGQGGTRGFLDVQPHEIERGLSADLSYAVYGFDDDGDEPIRMDNPHRKSDRAQIVEEADRLVSFVDTVGHEPWLRTTIRGLVGQKLDYGLLVVAADDGPTKTTREHLGILLATELPTIVAITKTDAVSDERLTEVEREVESTLRDAGQTPSSSTATGSIQRSRRSGTASSRSRTSAVTKGYRDARPAVRDAPEAGNPGARDVPDVRRPELQGDRRRRGGVRHGQLRYRGGGRRTPLGADGRQLLPRGGGALDRDALPPSRQSDRRPDRRDRVEGCRRVGDRTRDGARSPRQRLRTGPRVRGRGDGVEPPDADTGGGYEPVVHVETVSEAAVFAPEGGRLLPGDTGRTTIRFKFRPYLIEEGQRFVFREGSSKGVGTVRDVE